MKKTEYGLLAISCVYNLFLNGHMNPELQSNRRRQRLSEAKLNIRTINHFLVGELFLMDVSNHNFDE